LYLGVDGYAVATVGLFRPRIVFAPELLQLLDNDAVQAALEHERAHVRHRDPLRIWVGQIVTDLQWPWGSARQRFEAWLAALEWARDEEARLSGVDGADLAAAVLASVKFHRQASQRSCACLIGHQTALEERVARLLQPLSERSYESRSSAMQVAGLLTLSLLLAIALGAMFGERLVAPLLALSS
jgi:beta-lactamase regulating signal transducer with metallopeptidase domain